MCFFPTLPQRSQLCFRPSPIFAGGPQLFPVKEADWKRRKGLESRERGYTVLRKAGEQRTLGQVIAEQAPDWKPNISQIAGPTSTGVPEREKRK